MNRAALSGNVNAEEPQRDSGLSLGKSRALVVPVTMYVITPRLVYLKLERQGCRYLVLSFMLKFWMPSTASVAPNGYVACNVSVCICPKE